MKIIISYFWHDLGKDSKYMDERFLAKTKPYKEDIQEHTDILLKNYEILKELYPNLYIDWELLFLACIYHDLGKMNHKFQKKLRGFSNEDEIPHGYRQDFFAISFNRLVASS